MVSKTRLITAITAGMGTVHVLILQGWDSVNFCFTQWWCIMTLVVGWHFYTNSRSTLTFHWML